MAELKTKPNDADVDAFLASVDDPVRRRDSETVRKLLSEITGEPATMWGASIVGFGSYRYSYASGRTGDWAAIGFSPRKQQLTIYLMDGFSAHADLLARLGKHTTAKSCLYIKNLDDIDPEVLRDLLTRSYRTVTAAP